MRVHPILHVAAFELRSIMRSPMSLSFVLIPLLMYPAGIIAYSEIQQYETARLERESLRVSIEGPAELVSRFDEAPFERAQGDSASIRADALDLILTTEVTPAGWTVHLTNQDTRPRSKRARKEVLKTLDDLRAERLETLMVSLGDGAPEPYIVDQESVTPVDDTLGRLAGILAGLAACMSMMFSGVYPAVAMFVGEREAGTLETLLSAAVPRSTLLLGKVLAGATVMMVSAIANAIAAFLCMVQLIIMMTDKPEGFELLFGTELIGPAVRTTVLVLPVAITTALVVSSLLLLVVSGAKAYREAESLGSTALMVLLIPPSYAMAQLAAGEPTELWWLPLANLMEHATAAASGQAGVLDTLLATGVNGIWAALFTTLLYQMVNGENYLLGDLRPRWWRRLTQGGRP